MINEKHWKGTHSTSIGADKLAENTLNTPKFICPNCLSKPKNLGFRKKGLHLASIVRGKHITTEAERVIQYNKRKKNMWGEMDSGISVSDQVLTGY